MVEEDIVGKWKWSTISYDFRSDGTYDYVNTDSGVRTNGRYAITGDNELTYYINGPARSTFSLYGDRLTLIPEGATAANAATFIRVY